MAQSRTHTPAIEGVEFPRQRSFAELSEDENADEYEPGGYMRVCTGDTFKEGRYHAVKKIGWGHFSTVWLCLDVHEQRTCAIKIQKSSNHYGEAAREEIQVLRDLDAFESRGKNRIVAMIDHFEHKGHVCIVFQVLGKSLLRLIQRFNYNGVPLPLVRKIVRQLLEGLVFIHEEARCVHTDIKPENVLFVPLESELRALDKSSGAATDTQSGRELSEKECAEVGRRYAADIDLTFEKGDIKLVDFGNACWQGVKFASVIQTRQYRSPEVVIEAPYNSKVDMWSLACVTFELISGEYLFNPKGEEEDRDEKHIALMMELLGPMPLHFVQRGKAACKVFRDGSNELRNMTVHSWDMRYFLQNQLQLDSEEADEIVAFLLPLLRYDPESRVSAREALRHPFVSRVGKKQSANVASPVDVIPAKRSVAPTPRRADESTDISNGGGVTRTVAR